MNSEVVTKHMRIQTEGSKNKSFKKRLFDFTNVSVMHNIGAEISHPEQKHSTSRHGHRAEPALGSREREDAAAATGGDNGAVKQKFSLKK